MRGVQTPLAILSQAVRESGYADKVVYAMDAAASHWYDWEKGVYLMDGEEMTRDDVIGNVRQALS